MTRPVILTGLRANSEFHLGNYLGGILPMVELQKKHAGEYQINMFVPDLHSFTTPIDHSQLYQQTLDNLRLYVAAGLDITNADTFIYRQSYISAHSELTWILDCFAYFGELSRMTQFKDKAKVSENDIAKADVQKAIEQTHHELSQAFAEYKKFYKAIELEESKFLDTLSQLAVDAALHRVGFNQSSVASSAGLFNYPVLMAADILLYGAKWVPVGEDQRQHIELTRDLAMRLNNKFDRELFIVPEDWDKQLEFAERQRGVRVRSLRNPDKKMSKSVSDPVGTILLSDNPTEAGKKIMSATTDSIGTIHLDWENQPGISNMLQISALLAERPLQDVANEWEGKSSYGDLKKHVAEQVSAFLADLQAKYTNVDEEALRRKLEQDEEAMRQVANQTLLKVQQAVGLRPTS